MVIQSLAVSNLIGAEKSFKQAGIGLSLNQKIQNFVSPHGV